MELFFQLFILFLLLAGFSGIVIPNLIHLKKRIPAEKISCDISPQPPKISVLIPSRNEEKNIAGTLKSILNETYPNFEVLILDDNSTDKTAQIINEFTQKDSRIKCISGETLPQGWTGKNFACHQLSKAATGDYFLFTDADTTFHPGLLEFSLKQLLTTKSNLITGFPRLWSSSFWGKIIVPNVYFIFLNFMPMKIISDNRFPSIAMGSGAYLFFKKDSYLKIGGHHAVALATNEDMELVKKIKENKLTISSVDPSRFIDSKMYDNFREVWDGYSRSLFKALLGSYKNLAAFEISYFFLFIMPFINFIYYLIKQSQPELILVTALQISLILLLRSIIAFRFRQNWLSVILHPLSISLMLIIGVRSGILGAKHEGYSWKGRNYN